ncbi:hypothetical protein F4810DRAFT_716989 [Camillea tinctor]|nr:hypothetical protein F4810DRAFT_716989 [Camillea tinctor]
MVMLRKRTSPKGGCDGGTQNFPIAITPSPNESHVDPTNAPGHGGGSIRNRLKEIRGSIRGNIKKRLSTNSISFPREDAGAEDKQSWPTLRHSISSIATSLKNHRPSMDSGLSQNPARLFMPSHLRTSSRPSQDAERRSHTIHGLPTTPPLSRSGSNMRRLSLGALPERPLDHDSTPRLPSLQNMLAKTGESKVSGKGDEGHPGAFGDPDISVFDIDWHNIASHLPAQKEELLPGRQKTVTKGSNPISGRLPIRLKQAASSPTRNSPKIQARAANDKKRGSTADSGISGCPDSAAGSPPVDSHEDTRQTSLKWAPSSAPSTLEEEPPQPNPRPRSRAPFQTSKVPAHWLDTILEATLPLRSSSPPSFSSHPAHLPGTQEEAERIIARARRTNRIAVLTPSRAERHLPRLYYPDVGAAAHDLFRRFRRQYSAFMALAPGRRALYVFPAAAGRGDVACALAGGCRSRSSGNGKEEDVRVFDVENVVRGDWSEVGCIPGLTTTTTMTEGGGMRAGKTVGAEEEEDKSTLEWIDPEGEAYMRSEISLLQDYDDLEMASRLG